MMFFGQDLSMREVNRCRVVFGRFEVQPLSVSSGVDVIVLGFADEFFLLDPPVLEPDGDLALREVGGGRDAPSLVFGDELAGRVLLLQLLELDLGVRDALFAPATVTADLGLQGHDVCKGKRGTF